MNHFLRLIKPKMIVAPKRYFKTGSASNSNASDMESIYSEDVQMEDEESKK